VVQPLTASQQTYTVGPGAVWNMPRPVRIPSASFQDVSTGLEIPMHPLSEEEYQGIRLRGVSSTWPFQFYYDRAFPLATVFLWPVPTLANNVVLWPWHPWSSSNTLDTVVAFPPGYQRLLEYNLAVEVSTEYPGTLRPEIQALATQSQALVKTQNHAAPLVSTDVPQPRRQAPGGIAAWNAWLAGG
jgi:hypothetical protein